MLVCLVFLVILYKRLFSNELDFKLWDLQTVTVDDFSVELLITDIMWNTFETQVYDPKNRTKHKSEQFQDYLRKIIEEKLVEYSYKEEYAGLNLDRESLRIAIIEFDFDRQFLISLLKKRGAAIKAGKDKNKKKFEIEIKKQMEKRRDELLRPVSAFLTFEHASTVNLIDQIKKAEQKLPVNEAEMPSNIKWERRNFSGTKAFKHKL